MQNIENEEDIKQIIASDAWMMEVLRCARKLDLPDWMIGAGFVRNKVWDHLHGYAGKTVSETIDIDLIYYEPRDKDKATEKLYERELLAMMDENWTVKNHARMSDRYQSCEDGISYWPEVCTAIAVRLDAADELEIVAPFGVGDLVSLVVRKGYKFDDDEEYRDRIKRKKWMEKWPQLKIIYG